jgi:mono/diheme cytochrome c family protein
MTGSCSGACSTDLIVAPESRRSPHGEAFARRRRGRRHGAYRPRGCDIPVLTLALVLFATAFAAAAEPRLERGEYLAVRVAMCAQCHTPRDESGALITSRLFQGARVPVSSPFAGAQWATEAPALAGLAAVRREDLVSVLTLGARADGRVPRAPMPAYRLTREDAEAVADYLQSLSAPVR